MPIAVQIGHRFYAIHTDHLNTPRRLTDSNGSPVWQWAITAFGELEPTTAATGWIRERLGSAGPISNTQAVTFNLRYPGQQYDSETGLFYNHHRTYDPYLTVGYTEADPIGLAGGWNRFGYVGGDPLSKIDSSGLLQQCRSGLAATGGRDIGPLHHEYQCWNDNGKRVCRGFSFQEDRNPPLSLKEKIFDLTTGMIIKDQQNTPPGYDQSCGPDDRSMCMDKCASSVWSEFEKKPPSYGLIFGNTCQNIQQIIYEACTKACGK